MVADFYLREPSALATWVGQAALTAVTLAVALVIFAFVSSRARPHFVPAGLDQRVRDGVAKGPVWLLIALL